MTEFASNNGLEIVNKNTPTWTNGNQETLIDHCLTTKHQIFDTTVIEQLFGSDHFTQVFFSSLDIDYENNKTQFFYRDTSKFSRANLNKKNASADWSFMYQQNNANSTFEKFSIMFENILNSIAPIKIGEPSSKSTKKKWLSRKILNLINEKHRLFNIWKITADVDTYNSYKRIRNHTNRLLRRASHNYSQKLFESLPDSKQQWKFIKTKIKHEDKNGEISRIRFNQDILKDKKEIADTINICFSKLGLYEGETEKIELPDFAFDKTEFSFRHVTRKELFTVIDQLPQNKAAGPGLLTTWSFKCSKMSIGTHLQFAINECISKNIFPDILKKAYVTPIYKKGDPLEAGNYRPISVTPTLAKIFERLLLQQMLEHVEKYEIINKNQFGFLKRKSSNDTVISLTESVNSLLEENETVVSIFLDLAKAFNSISHKIFLEKITKYGFSTEPIAMLESFLSNRKQCVKNGIEYSNWVTINHGVPQGTVLGPLIFLIYINDFPEKMKKREDVLQFADDTCIICHSKSDENLLCEINSVFESTDSYMRQNMLTLNRDKTEIVVFFKKW